MESVRDQIGLVRPKSLNRLSWPPQIFVCIFVQTYNLSMEYATLRMPSIQAGISLFEGFYNDVLKHRLFSAQCFQRPVRLSNLERLYQIFVAVFVVHVSSAVVLR